MFDDLPSPPPPADPQHIVPLLQAWHNRWIFRFSTWLGTQSQIDFEQYITAMPDLVQLTINVLESGKLVEAQQQLLIAASEYVLNPNDLMPEDVHGVAGFLEDALIMATPLRVIAESRADFLREHWEADGDVLDLLNQLEAHREDILAFASTKPSGRRPSAPPPSEE